MLTLRPFRKADREHLIAYLNDPAVTRYLSGRIPQPYGVDDANWWLSEGCTQGVIRAIDVDGEFVGCIGAEPGQNEYRYTAEVGYWLSQHAWGKGYATEALRQLVSTVQGTTNIARLQAAVFEGNLPSCRVLSKCDFVHEATLPKAIFKNGRFYASLIYGKVLSW